MNTPLLRTSFLAITLGLAACRTLPDGAPVTPQRPTVSADTNTTAEKTFELEAGVAIDPGDAYSTPMALKYGLSDVTEVFVGWAPLLSIDMGGVDETGIGDVNVGVRHRFQEETDDVPSAALLASLKLPTADDDDGLGTGELDLSLGGAMSKTLDPLSVTGYYTLDVLGDPRGGTLIGHTVAVAGSQTVADSVAAFGEFAAILVPEADVDILLATLGGTYTHSASQVFDAALVIGLSEDAPDLQMLIGFTHNFGRSSRRASPAPGR